MERIVQHSSSSLLCNALEQLLDISLTDEKVVEAQIAVTPHGIFVAATRRDRTEIRQRFDLNEELCRQLNRAFGFSPEELLVEMRLRFPTNGLITAMARKIADQRFLDVDWSLLK